KRLGDDVLSRSLADMARAALAVLRGDVAAAASAYRAAADGYDAGDMMLLASSARWRPGALTGCAEARAPSDAAELAAAAGTVGRSSGHRILPVVVARKVRDPVIARRAHHGGARGCVLNRRSFADIHERMPWLRALAIAVLGAIALVAVGCGGAPAPEARIAS